MIIFTIAESINLLLAALTLASFAKLDHLDTDDFSSMPEVESITKRATAWIDKWEKEIKNANLSNKEKIEIINEYEKLFENYKK